MSRVHYPTLAERVSIEAEDLLRLDDPCVIFEGEHRDTDGITAYVYTVGGWIDGAPVGGSYGVTVGGDAIIVHADSRAAADALAGDGLLSTIDAMRDGQPRQQTRAGVLAGVSEIGRRH